MAVRNPELATAICDVCGFATTIMVRILGNFPIKMHLEILYFHISLYLPVTVQNTTCMIIMRSDYLKDVSCRKYLLSYDTVPHRYMYIQKVGRRMSELVLPLVRNTQFHHLHIGHSNFGTLFIRGHVSKRCLLIG